MQPEDPGCYTSNCPPGCQLVLIARLNDPLGGLYYGIPALPAYQAVSPGTRLYKNTASSQVNAQGKWAFTYYMFHQLKLNMWVIGKGKESLTNLNSSNILAKSGQSSQTVVPVNDRLKKLPHSTKFARLKWEWGGITPLCMDDNKCRNDLNCNSFYS